MFRFCRIYYYFIIHYIYICAHIKILAEKVAKWYCIYYIHLGSDAQSTFLLLISPESSRFFSKTYPCHLLTLSLVDSSFKLLFNSKSHEGNKFTGNNSIVFIAPFLIGQANRKMSADYLLNKLCTVKD